MLNDIRKMILERKEFQEAAEIIFEDGMGNLDDQIVLGEENNTPQDTEPTTPEDNDTDLDDTDIETPEDGKENNEDPAPAEPEVNPEPAPEPAPSTEPDEDGSPMPLPTGDGELPTPVGAQTGEPINDPDDLLDVSIDLKSNTIRDVLPVPPANAGEAIGDNDDDLLGQRIDSGFGGEDPAPAEPEVDTNPAQPPENTPPEENGTPEEPTDESQLTEAITLGNDAPGGEDPAPAEDAPPTDDSTPPDSSTEPPAEESPVTAAVKDKVEEITDDAGGEGSASKDDLLKKLGNITKSLEDAKKAVMNTLQ